MFWSAFSVPHRLDVNFDDFRPLFRLVSGTFFLAPVSCSLPADSGAHLGWGK